MSLAQYEDFVYGACHVDGDADPIAHWEAVSAQLTARAGELTGVRELRIVGPDTDLRVIVEGRPWIPSDGRHNMPDGEVFTSPVETGTEGEIYFAFPSIFQGQEVEDVRLRFEGGRVVQAEASTGQDYLRALIETDEGAAVLGEVAFGLNYEIDRFTRDILFDEKIGGTMHVALGGGFERGRDEEHVRPALGPDLRPPRRRRGLRGRRARLARRQLPHGAGSRACLTRGWRSLRTSSSATRPRSGPGDVVRIEGNPPTTPLIRELYRASLAAGAHPSAGLLVDEAVEALLENGTDEQLEWVPLDVRWNLEHGDVWIVLDGPENTKHLSGVDPAKMARRVRAREPYQARYLERSHRGEFRWVLCGYPTEAAAQDAGMSLSEFEELVYGAAFLDAEDPVAAWQRVRRASWSASARFLERKTRAAGRRRGHRPDARRRAAGPGFRANGHDELARRRGLHRARSRRASRERFDSRSRR